MVFFNRTLRETEIFSKYEQEIGTRFQFPVSILKREKDPVPKYSISKLEMVPVSTFANI
jgi:hypothetical protein